MFTSMPAPDYAESWVDRGFVEREEWWLWMRPGGAAGVVGRGVGCCGRRRAVQQLVAGGNERNERRRWQLGRRHGEAEWRKEEVARSVRLLRRRERRGKTAQQNQDMVSSSSGGEDARRSGSRAYYGGGRCWDRPQAGGPQEHASPGGGRLSSQRIASLLPSWQERALCWTRLAGSGMMY